MCVRRPDPVGYEISSTSNGRLEHKSGSGAKSRWRAYRYILGANGRPSVETRTYSGDQTEVIPRFRSWSTAEGTISEKEAMDMDRASKERAKPAPVQTEKVAKGGPYESTENLVEAVLMMAQEVANVVTRLDRLVASNCEVARNLVALQRTVADIPMMVAEMPPAVDDKRPVVPFEKKPTAVSDEQVTEFARSLDILDIVNTQTKFAYARFVDWCRERDVEPCSSMMVSRRVSKVHGLVVESGRFKRKVGGD